MCNNFSKFGVPTPSKMRVSNHSVFITKLHILSPVTGSQPEVLRGKFQLHDNPVKYIYKCLRLKAIRTYHHRFSMIKTAYM